MTRRRPRIEGVRVLVFSLAAGLMALCGKADAGNVCRATSLYALRSCLLQAKTDYQLTLGKCVNLTDSAERRAGLRQAAADYKAAVARCKEQYAVRKEICARLGGAPYDPLINSNNFVGHINNPFFPLTPGTTYYYLGRTVQGVQSRSNVVSVTYNTAVILGVTCVEVHSLVYVGGQLAEDALDWYAQDKKGNVWHFGKHAEQISGGLTVGLKGCFLAGKDGAKPGIIMKAQPAVGDFYRQEFLLNDAEGVAEVISLDENVRVPAGAYEPCLKTKDSSALAPHSLNLNFYAQGVGKVLTLDEVTGDRLELVRVQPER